mmetsp:Transcript_61601/g.144411  ORF Transcript_61601/g.144411 Transcript_61601/m.144411 type:complete len:201 (+) Transcript_61601:231-833(+)
MPAAMSKHPGLRGLWLLPGQRCVLPRQRKRRSLCNSRGHRWTSRVSGNQSSLHRAAGLKFSWREFRKEHEGLARGPATQFPSVLAAAFRWSDHAVSKSDGPRAGGHPGWLARPMRRYGEGYRPEGRRNLSAALYDVPAVFSLVHRNHLRSRGLTNMLEWHARHKLLHRKGPSTCASSEASARNLPCPYANHRSPGAGATH